MPNPAPRRRSGVLAAIFLAFGLVGCSDDDDVSPIPIVSGQATVTWADEQAEIGYGVARRPHDDNGRTIADGPLMLLLATVPFGCAPVLQPPTSGFAVVAELPGTEAGASGSMLIQVTRFEGDDLRGLGTTGPVTVTAIDAEQVSATFGLDMTHDDVGRVTASGELTVQRCHP